MRIHWRGCTGLLEDALGYIRIHRVTLSHMRIQCFTLGYMSYVAEHFIRVTCLKSVTEQFHGVLIFVTWLKFLQVSCLQLNMMYSTG